MRTLLAWMTSPAAMRFTTAPSSRRIVGTSAAWPSAAAMAGRSDCYRLSGNRRLPAVAAGRRRSLRKNVSACWSSRLRTATAQRPIIAFCPAIEPLNAFFARRRRGKTAKTLSTNLPHVNQLYRLGCTTASTSQACERARPEPAAARPQRGTATRLARRAHGPEAMALTAMKSMRQRLGRQGGLTYEVEVVAQHAGERRALPWAWCAGCCRRTLCLLSHHPAHHPRHCCSRAGTAAWHARHVCA